jgi:uncharacterized protein
VAERNLPAVTLLIEAGADPRLETRIDDYETPREIAERARLREIATLLAECEERLGKYWIYLTNEYLSGCADESSS